MQRDPESWWLEETIHARREHFDEHHTRRYDAKEDAQAAEEIAVDVSPLMLERLAEKVDLCAASNVEVTRAGFLTYQHAGPPADVVYSRYALHHLPDFWKAIALGRLADMLRLGGVLRLWDVVYSFEPRDADRQIEGWIADTMAADVERGWTRAELAEHVRDEHSTFTWLLEPMIERAGFDIVQADYSASVFARYVCKKT